MAVYYLESSALVKRYVAETRWTSCVSRSA